MSTVEGYRGNFSEYIPFSLDDIGARILTTILGFIIGLITAAIVSGVLATFINISQETTLIRQLLMARRTPSDVGP